MPQTVCAKNLENTAREPKLPKNQIKLKNSEKPKVEVVQKLELISSFVLNIAYDYGFNIFQNYSKMEQKFNKKGQSKKRDKNGTLLHVFVPTNLPSILSFSNTR